MKPDLKMAKKFLVTLDPKGTYTFQTFDDNSVRKAPAFARVFHGTFAQHQQQLAQLNAGGAGVFVMVNEGDGVTHDGHPTCRCRVNVVRVRKLFVDLDGSPLKPVLDATPAPDIVVESSVDKWHAYWDVVDCPLVAFKAAQLALAARFNGDFSVSDLPRVMRLPGFFHQKNAPVMTMLRNVRRNEK